MAFKQETVTSFTDLITKINTWMSSVGWTSEHLDTTTTAITGGEWAMRRTAGATNIRFSASWDGAGTPTNLALYQYSDQNYVIADRPWGQDHDSGNGLGISAPDGDVDDERHVKIGTTPIQYWGFEDDDYTHIVVETASGRFVHFGWGILLKFGDWTGGEYCYGQRNNLTAFTGGAATFDGMSYGMDGHTNDTPDGGGLSSLMEQFAATIHCESLPNQTANGMWAVNMGGTAASPQTAFGLDRQSNDGASSDTARVLFTDGLRQGPAVDGFYRMAQGLDLNGHQVMWEIAPRYVDTTTDDVYGPMGRQPDVRGMSVANFIGGDEVAQGGDTWIVFPAEFKHPGSGTGSSGNLGIAYKKVV